MAHLYAARALDISGKRNEAISHYRLVLSRPDIFDAHDGAKKGLQEPYRIETRQALHKGDESVQQN
jgi:hypothetical protein